MSVKMLHIKKTSVLTTYQGYIFWQFLSKLKNWEEFEGGLHEKRKGKRKKKKK